MASLEARFDAVQESLLQIYESESSSLELCYQYWQLIRKENALYFTARQQGKTRLGLYAVPATRVSEQKAKDAIKMTLYLESLKQTQFATERWTLMDTSSETFMAPPENTFKKRGQHVTVVYDHDANNSMLYTLWTELYYLDTSDTWHKTTSSVDYDGIFYIDIYGTKIYYINFQDDASLYSNSGQWEVHFENKVLSPPVTSSLPVGTSGRRRAQTGDHAQPGGRKPSQLAGDSRRRSQSQSSSRSRSRSRSPTKEPHSGRREAGIPGQQQGRPPGRRRGESPEQRIFGGPSPPTPGQVGGRHRSPSSKPTSRLARLINEAYDPPVLLLQGPANILKCFRRRATQTHGHRFLCMSTSWTWVCKTSPLKSGHRMLIAFTNCDQRKGFLSSVRLPKGVTFVKGSLTAYSICY
ncbi:E2 protein [Bos taurus papillomavirus 11]|uniref:Regulatory protein E2 n=1 Tax=Bos taurus papillomavirus 11 TaxID=714200 RepID=E1CGC0_9PAPI|nr:E2 protein [Bos taurus papillomavirus 11]